MVFSLSLFGEKVFASIDLDRDCSLTISAGSMMLEELPDANVEIDLYRVADAIPVQGFDTYDWQVNEPFAYRGITIDKNIDNAGWRELANKAANIVLGEAPEGKTEWDPSDSINAIPDEIKKMGQLPDTKIERGIRYDRCQRGSRCRFYRQHCGECGSCRGHSYDRPLQALSLQVLAGADFHSRQNNGQHTAFQYG